MENQTTTNSVSVPNAFITIIASSKTSTGKFSREVTEIDTIAEDEFVTLRVTFSQSPKAVATIAWRKVNGQRFDKISWCNKPFQRLATLSTYIGHRLIVETVDGKYYYIAATVSRQRTPHVDVQELQEEQYMLVLDGLAASTLDAERAEAESKTTKKKKDKAEVCPEKSLDTSNDVVEPEPEPETEPIIE